MSPEEDIKILRKRSSMLSWTLNVLKKYGVKPSKRRDQHFLVSPSLIRDLTKLINKVNRKLCVEIGTGIGTLTLALSQLFQRVITVEIDPRLASVAKRVLPSNVAVVVGDGIALAKSLCSEVYISNTPYSISSQLIASLARNNCAKEVFLVVQKELANRILASPGEENYGRFTLLVRRYFRPKLIAVYSPHHFYPPPQIDSALIYLSRTRPWKDSDEAFEVITACLFSGRNKLAKKMIKKCLNIEESALRWLGLKRVKDLTLWDIENILELTRST